MSRAIFAIAVFIALGLDVSVTGVLALGADTRITPTFLGVVAVFIGLFASRSAVLWGCWIIGVVTDLCLPLGDPGGGPVRLIGPHALGFVAAGFMLLQLRTMVFRRRALTVAVLTFAAMAMVYLVAIAIYTVRSWLPGGDLVWAGFQPLDELLRRFFMALYTAGLAFPVGFLLVRTLPLWGFQMKTNRSVTYRG